MFEVKCCLNSKILLIKVLWKKRVSRDSRAKGARAKIRSCAGGWCTAKQHNWRKKGDGSKLLKENGEVRMAVIAGELVEYIS